MGAFTALAFALATQGSSATLPGSTEAVIVTDVPIPYEMRTKLDAMSVPERVALYVKQGFERVDKSGRTYLFAPQLWGGKEIAEELAIWKDATDHVQPDGSINLAVTPALREGAGALFEGAGYQGCEGANALLSRSVRLTLSVHGVAKIVQLGGAQTPQEQDRLRAKPMTRRPSDAPTPKLLPKYPGNFVVPDSVCVLSPGSRAYSAVLRMQETSEASGILAERYQKRQAAIRQAQTNLKQKVAKFGFLADVAPNSLARDLPADAQWEINWKFERDFQRMGFDSAEDAESFLRNAKVDGISSSITLVVAAAGATNGQPSYYGFGLP